MQPVEVCHDTNVKAWDKRRFASSRHMVRAGTFPTFRTWVFRHRKLRIAHQMVAFEVLRQQDRFRPTALTRLIDPHKTYPGSIGFPFHQDTFRHLLRRRFSHGAMLPTRATCKT